MEIKLELCRPMLFSKVFSNSRKAALLSLVEMVSFETYAPQETIFAWGQICSKMYFIQFGKVELTRTTRRKRAVSVSRYLTYPAYVSMNLKCRFFPVPSLALAVLSPGAGHL